MILVPDMSIWSIQIHPWDKYLTELSLNNGQIDKWTHLNNWQLKANTWILTSVRAYKNGQMDE